MAVPVQPAETAGPSTAAAASAAQSATKPQRPPPSSASPAAVAALLARGDALIAIGDVAAARLVYQRAAALASARAATATGKTYDARFLQAIGAIGVVADPEAAAAWYRKGAALGDEDAAPLLGGLDLRASQ
jgi:TPR repeat protein